MVKISCFEYSTLDIALKDNLERFIDENKFVVDAISFEDERGFSYVTKDGRILTKERYKSIANKFTEYGFGWINLGIGFDNEEKRGWIDAYGFFYPYVLVMTPENAKFLKSIQSKLLEKYPTDFSQFIYKEFYDNN